MFAKVTSIFSFGLVVFASSAFGQAFGIEMGTKTTELTVAEELSDNRYMVKPEKGHSEFSTYVVTSTDETGVYVVKGIGKDHANDGYGLSVQKSFDALEKALSQKYGDFGENKFLRSGALWDKLDDWVMAVRQNERAHQSVWEKDKGSSLPDDISEILLTIDATGSNSAWISLQYRFANYLDCNAEIAKANEQGL